MLTAPNPPVIQPTSDVVKSIRFLPTLPFSIRLPAKINNGTARSVNDVDASANSCGTIIISGTGLKINITRAEAKPSETAIGAPITRINAQRITRVNVIIGIVLVYLLFYISFSKLMLFENISISPVITFLVLNIRWIIPNALPKRIGKRTMYIGMPRIVVVVPFII